MERYDILHEERRFARVLIGLDTIAQMMVKMNNNSDLWMRVNCGVPQDAIVVDGGGYDFTLHCFHIIFAHESFESVAEGTSLQFINIVREVKTIELKE